MKKFFIIFIFALLCNAVFTASVFWCKHKWKIDQCNQANLKWTEKSIQNFVCITGTNEQVAYQVTLDQEFKKLDEEMDQFVQDLEDNKNTYFWIARKKTYIDGINDIHAKSDYFYNEYNKICWEVLMKEVQSCMQDQVTSISRAKDHFEETDCKALVAKKLQIFGNVTFSIMQQNKQQIKQDEKKIYDQGQRANYNKLLDIMRINLWYIERIWMKTPSLIQNPHHG